MPRTAKLQVKLKRAYDAPAKSDGRRVLVDRIWPRGITKTELGIADWVKDVAPSTALRRWFGHEPSKWSEFKKRFFKELDKQPEAIGSLLQGRGSVVTLVFAAKDVERNNAVALKEYVERHGKRTARRTAG